MSHIILITAFLLVAACLATLLGLPVFAWLAFPLLLASIGRAGIKLIPLLWDKTGGSRDLSILHTGSPRPKIEIKPPAEPPILDILTGILWLVVVWHYRYLVVFGIIGAGLSGFRAGLILLLGMAVSVAVVLYLAIDYLGRRWRFTELILVTILSITSVLPIGKIWTTRDGSTDYPWQVSTGGNQSRLDSTSVSQRSVYQHSRHEAGAP